MLTHRALALVALAALAPAALAQTPSDAASPPVPRYEGVGLLVDAALGLPAPEAAPAPAAPTPLVSFAPLAAAPLGVAPLDAADVALPALPVADAPAALLAADTLRSPVDTLDMSAWERLWWGSGGIMRQTGLFPIHPGNPVEDFRQIATVRRRMLSLHQILGFATVASMTATVVSGQITLNGGSSAFHEASIPITIGLYATTATLALTSPPKLISDRGGFDSITLHKYLAVAHIAGMVITPLLAPDFEDGEAHEGGPTIHQIMGYTTLGTLTAAMLVATFLR